MSKSTLGQKGLGLSTRLLVGTGLVLALTQSLEEETSAGKSLAELRQQAWTQKVFTENLLETRGSQGDILEFDAEDNRLASARSALRTVNKQALERKAALTAANDTASLVDLSDPSGANQSLVVNRKGKQDRRIGWGWEPYRVSHGRKSIAMNWSGAVWSMAGPFTSVDHVDLPKMAFAPSDDLELVMADASKFLLPEAIGQAPNSMFAKQSAPETPGAVDPTVTGSTALAYAPTSVEALEAPFNAILTEQRSGQVSRENQVTILDASELEKEKSSGKNTEANNKTGLIAALPRPRAPMSAKPTEANQLAKVSQPLDVTPVVIDLQNKEAKELAAVKKPDSKEGLTLAKSKAVRAELKLASLSGDTKTNEKKKSRFASWFNFSSKPKQAKIVTKGEHGWITNKLPKSSFTKKQKTCLANAIYFESRSEPEKGQIAVAQVVINRVKNPAYPNSICGVVYQNKHKRNACQFSFACDRIPDRVRSKKAWDLAWKLSNQVVNGEVWLKEIGSSTHYHATYVKPRWAKTMKRRAKIGLHIFFKTYGGGWS